MVQLNPTAESLAGARVTLQDIALLCQGILAQGLPDNPPVAVDVVRTATPCPNGRVRLVSTSTAINSFGAGMTLQIVRNDGTAIPLEFEGAGAGSMDRPVLLFPGDALEWRDLAAAGGNVTATFYYVDLELAP